MTTRVTTSFGREQTLPTISRFGAIIGILGFLTLIGVTAGVGRLFLGLSGSTALTDGYPWGIWIGFDFTLIAFSGAGFTIAALVHVLHLKTFEPVARPAILAGLLGYSAVLALLVLDLGRPDRFYNFILFWNIHSPLFEISWCVLLYTTVLVIEVSPCVLERLNRQQWLALVHKAMAPVTIIGVTLSTLHQSTLGTLYLNMPHRLNTLWYTPILPLLFFISSIMAGLALGMIAYRLGVSIKRQPTNPAITTGLGKILLWVSLVYLAVKLTELTLSGDLPQLLAFNQPGWLMLAELGLGVVLPVALLAAIKPQQQLWVQWAAPLLVLLGVMFNRFNATMFGQILPANTHYSPHILEWLSTIGIVAGVTLVWVLAVRFLAICDTDAHS